jgi:predicted nucleic acid-binding protein
MSENRIVTYGLLAYINETNHVGIKDFNDIFMPLVKRVLSELDAKGINKGTQEDLKKAIDVKYGLDMPYNIMRMIVKKIANECNTETHTHFQAFENDGSFIMHNYIFADYEEETLRQENEIELIQKGFERYLESQNIKLEITPSIFKFIDKNRKSLSKFFAHQKDSVNGSGLNEEELVQAEFLNSIKNSPNIFNTMRRIYLGSIITSYLEMSFEKLPNSIEFVLDTNFITSLLDLNSVESHHTCAKIIEICQKLGHKIVVLTDTIKETENLLMNHAQDFEKSFLSKKIDDESIYNACDRRKYGKTDLERVANSFENELQDKFNIFIIPSTDEYQRRAKVSKEYEILKDVRKNKQGMVYPKVWTILV